MGSDATYTQIAAALLSAGDLSHCGHLDELYRVVRVEHVSAASVRIHYAALQGRWTGARLFRSKTQVALAGELSPNDIKTREQLAAIATGRNIR